MVDNSPLGRTRPPRLISPAPHPRPGRCGVCQALEFAGCGVFEPEAADEAPEDVEEEASDPDPFAVLAAPAEESEDVSLAAEPSEDEASALLVAELDPLWESVE